MPGMRATGYGNRSANGPAGPRLVVAAAIVTLLITGGLCGAAAAAARDSANEVELQQAICRVVDTAAAANRLPSAFLTRILWQESRFHSDATSPAGAEGVAQFMPRTAAERGLTDPREPVPAIAQAARLLADLAARFGNLGLAAAGYNAGAARIARWLHAQSDLPAETRRYVLAVTGRTPEEWAHGGAAQPIAVFDRRPCLGVMADLVRSVPDRARGSEREARLYRLLARAVGLLSEMSRRRSAGGEEAVLGAERLCDSVRTLGAHCAVYGH